jgi:hypothetical protein
MSDEDEADEAGSRFLIANNIAIIQVVENNLKCVCVHLLNRQQQLDLMSPKDRL